MENENSKVEETQEIITPVNGEKEGEEKNDLKWRKVEVKLIGIGEEKVYSYQAPWKINYIKKVMWFLAHPDKK